MTKQEQRSRALAARKAMPAAERAAASAAICAKLAELPALQEPCTVLSYRALSEEVELQALHEALLARCCRLVFPVTLPDRSLAFYAPRSWVTGRFGVTEPDVKTSLPVSPEEIDVALIPCVGFDEQGRRLGHGAGCYDRTLPRCVKALRIAVAFEAQKLSAVVCDEHDLPMDRIVTEKALISRTAIHRSTAPFSGDCDK